MILSVRYKSKGWVGVSGVQDGRDRIQCAFADGCGVTIPGGRFRQSQKIRITKRVDVAVSSSSEASGNSSKITITIGAGAPILAAATLVTSLLKLSL